MYSDRRSCRLVYDCPLEYTEYTLDPPVEEMSPPIAFIMNAPTTSDEWPRTEASLLPEAVDLWVDCGEIAQC